MHFRRAYWSLGLLRPHELPGGARRGDRRTCAGRSCWVETLIQYLLLDKTYAEQPDFEGRQVRDVAAAAGRAKSGRDVERTRQRAGQHGRHRSRALRFRRSETNGPRRFHQNPERYSCDRRPRKSSLHATASNAAGSIFKPSLAVASTKQRSSLVSSLERGRSLSAATRTSSSTTLITGARLTAETQTQNLDYNAFEGWEIEGRPTVVTVRGEVAVRDGKFVGTIGRGRFLQRQPTHGRDTSSIARGGLHRRRQKAAPSYDRKFPHSPARHPKGSPLCHAHG